MNHTRAPETEATFMLPVWPNPLDDEDSAHRGQILRCILKEWGSKLPPSRRLQLQKLRRRHDKVEDAAADKDDDKLMSSKPRWLFCHLKKKELSKRTEPLDDYFGPSQSQNSQDIMPVDTPKKSEEAKLRNNPDGSSH